MDNVIIIGYVCWSGCMGHNESVRGRGDLSTGVRMRLCVSE
jgi:hypothetical protein